MGAPSTRSAAVRYAAGVARGPRLVLRALLRRLARKKMAEPRPRVPEVVIMKCAACRARIQQGGLCTYGCQHDGELGKRQVWTERYRLASLALEVRRYEQSA
jgi:hypothetical protein